VTAVSGIVHLFTAVLLRWAASLMFSDRVTLTLKLYAGERSWLRLDCWSSARLARFADPFAITLEIFLRHVSASPV